MQTSLNIFWFFWCHKDGTTIKLAGSRFALRYATFISLKYHFAKKITDLIQRWWPFVKWGRICLLFALFASVTHLSISHHDNVNGKNSTSFCSHPKSSRRLSIFLPFSSRFLSPWWFFLCLLCCLKNHSIHHEVDKLV